MEMTAEEIKIEDWKEKKAAETMKPEGETAAADAGAAVNSEESASDKPVVDAGAQMPEKTPERKPESMEAKAPEEKPENTEEKAPEEKSGSTEAKASEEKAGNTETKASEEKSGSTEAKAPEDEREKNPFAEDDRESYLTKLSRIHSRRKTDLLRDEMILSRIRDEDLMEYLHLEQERLKLLQKEREVREKRIWLAFQLCACLIAAVLMIYFLKDNPAILISILYLVGLLAGIHLYGKHKKE